MKVFPILRELRNNKNLTQAQLAKELNLGQRTISSYENGEREPLATSLMAYADFFEVSIDYLVGREDDFGNINIPDPVGEQLNKEESDLLKFYREIDKELQRRALAYMRRLHDTVGDETAALRMRGKK